MTKSHRQATQDLEAALILKEMSALTKSKGSTSPSVSPSLPRKKRKYSHVQNRSLKSSVDAVSQESITTTSRMMVANTSSRSVTPPSISNIVQRTPSPPLAEQKSIQIVSPSTSPKSTRSSAVNLSAVQSKVALPMGDVRPLTAPPPMRNFCNFQKNNDNMRTLSLLAKKKSDNGITNAHENRSSNDGNDAGVGVRPLVQINNHFTNDTASNSIRRSVTPEERHNGVGVTGTTNSTNVLARAVSLPLGEQEVAVAAAATTSTGAISPNLMFCYPTDTNHAKLQQQLLRSLAFQAQLQSLMTLPQHQATGASTSTSTSTMPFNASPSNEKSKGPPTKKRKICKMEGCCTESDKRTPYCVKHRGQRKCESDGCIKFAQSKTRFCIKHGGGRRCTFPNCNKGARDKFFCGAHGGGKRCTAPNCPKLAVGSDSVCTAHGGGKRCQEVGCTKSAQSSSFFCVRHGGGRKCKMDGCEKVARGKQGLCMSHTTATNKRSDDIYEKPL